MPERIIGSTIGSGHTLSTSFLTPFDAQCVVSKNNNEKSFCASASPCSPNQQNRRTPDLEQPSKTQPPKLKIENEKVPEEWLEKVAARAKNKREASKPAPVGTSDTREKKNGVLMPKAGTKGALAWDIADKIRKAKPKLTYKELRPLIIAEGMEQGEKKSQMSAEASTWGKFHGLR